MQSLHEAVGLGTLHLGGAVLDPFQLQEELVGMPIRPAAEFAAVVGEDGLDGGAVLVEGRQDVVVEQLHGRERQLVGVEPGPGVPAVAVDGRLHVDPPHALEGPTWKVSRRPAPRWRGSRCGDPGTRSETLQEPDLLVGQLDASLLGVLLEAQQALVLGQQVVPAPDPADPTGADLDPLQSQLLGHPQAALGGGVQAVGQDGLLHLRADPVGMRPSGPGEPIDQALGP